ncbi:MAG: cytochrome c [Thermodesulfobacteriota bacterium]
MKKPFRVRGSVFRGKPLPLLITFFMLVPLVLLSSKDQAVGEDTSSRAGQRLYESHCADCHRFNGQGLPVKFPALDKNVFVTGDSVKLIDLVLNGRKGKLGQMPGWKETFKDQEVAFILTYIRQTWSNKAGAVSPEMVKKRRK